MIWKWIFHKQWISNILLKYICMYPIQNSQLLNKSLLNYNGNSNCIAIQTTKFQWWMMHTYFQNNFLVVILVSFFSRNHSNGSFQFPLKFDQNISCVKTSLGLQSNFQVSKVSSYLQKIIFLSANFYIFSSTHFELRKK